MVAPKASISLKFGKVSLPTNVGNFYTLHTNAVKRMSMYEYGPIQKGHTMAKCQASGRDYI